MATLLYGYGNWCALGTHDYSQPPIDEIDQCCQHHDFCYDNVTTSGTVHPSEVEYSWTSAEDNTTWVCNDCSVDGVSQ